jgi:hypothetical protein
MAEARIRDDAAPQRGRLGLLAEAINGIDPAASALDTVRSACCHLHRSCFKGYGKAAGAGWPYAVDTANKPNRTIPFTAEKYGIVVTLRTVIL